MLKYFQKQFNSCCLSSLASDFSSIKQTKADNAISTITEEYFKSQMGNCIDLANSI